MKKRLVVFMALVVILFTACSSKPVAPVDEIVVDDSEDKQPADDDTDTQVEESAEVQEGESAEVQNMKKELTLSISDEELTVEWESNDSVAALMDMAEGKPIFVEMSRYGGFEQVGALDVSLPRNDEQMTTSAGDIVLYSGNQIVIFYGSNSWAYTKLGRIIDKFPEELRKLLSEEDVTVRLDLKGAIEGTSDGGAEAAENASQNSDVLVIYFSATGTTKGVAEKIAALTGADTHEIVAAQEYTSADLDWHDPNSRTSIEQNDPNSRPEISSEPISLDGYDTIYIGYPIWWGVSPRIMETFVEGYNFDGKTVIPFCTSGSSGIGNSSKNLAELAGTGMWLDGKRFGSGDSESEIQDWLNTL